MLLAIPTLGAVILVPSGVSTIQGAHDGTLNAGDTIYVDAAAYTGDERVSWTKDGSAGNYITVVSTNGQALMRGFALSGVSYVKFINFEIRHTNTTHTRGFNMTGANDHVEIIDCYIHNTHEPAIMGATSATQTDIVIRGNRIDYVANPGSLRNPEAAIVGTPGGAHRWLIEYNHISRSGDYVNGYGSNTVVRNNWMYGSTNQLWLTNGMHWDGIQSGSDGLQVYMRHQLYEANLIGDIYDTHAADGLDGHVGIFQDNSGFGDTNVLVRRNVGYLVASGGWAALGTDGAKFIHNTVHRFAMAVDGGAYKIFGGGGSVGGLIGNNIVSSNDVTKDVLLIDSGHTGILTNNLGFQSNPETSYVSTNDPLFVDITARNFKINTGSPAINLGTTNLLWITSATGSGTSFDVNDSGLVRDGDGIIEGDLITLVGGSSVRVTDVTGNTVTVASSVSWGQGQAIVYGTDTTPDIGAIPNSATFLTAATFSVSGDTATITPTGDARKVWKYRRGIPVAEDYETPFNFADHQAGDTYKVGALWAQPAPLVVTAAEAPPGPTVTTIAGAGAVGRAGAQAF